MHTWCEKILFIFQIHSLIVLLLMEIFSSVEKILIYLNIFWKSCYKISFTIKRMGAVLC